MDSMTISRRAMLLTGGAAVATLAAPLPVAAQLQTAAASTQPQPQDATRAQRMQWWHAATFGMFIHFGVYSTIQRHEWEMENEGPSTAEYMAHARTFHPARTSPQAWARLAKRAGMKYMVLTTKHHEGFCNFDTDLTAYNAVRQGPGFDLVREYVNAARAEGLRGGFYYSLMDWHHPDGAACAHDEAARRRFVAYTHGLIRTLLTNYGKIDVLWYDVDWPLDARGWESARMNEMVFTLQPEIVVNNRNGLDGDFATPEQKIEAAANGRAWESCMTLNESWGYQRADANWKSSKTIVRNLISCARDGGNYLLNIGPEPDGSVPEESVKVLTEVGDWLAANGESVYGCDPCQPRKSNYASFTRKGHTLYLHVYFWPGEYLAIGGLMTRVKSARLLKTGAPVAFEQNELQARFTGLPIAPPDFPVTTLAIDCEGVPTQDNLFVRVHRPRAGV